MRDLIFVSMEDWDDQWRRNQFVCAELARRFPEMKILFLGVPRNAWRCLAKGRIGEILRSPVTGVPGYPNITVTRALRIGLERYAWGRKLNQFLTRREIRRRARKLKMDRPLLWLNPYWALHMVGRMTETGTIYDITDDWELATLPARQKQQIVDQDRRLCAAADLTVVCSQALYDSRRTVAKRIALLPNGVHPAHYSQPADSSGQARRWTAPVFGYTGTLHPDRIDAELVLATARAFPQGSVVLVGPDHLDAATRARLGTLPNIYRTGAVPYREVPQVMGEFDVCIVPHLRTPFTESLNPIKLWEYFALGKPIVASDVAGFRDFPQLCRLARDPEQFAAACREALTENGSRIDARRRVAGQNSWSARVDGLLEAIFAAGLMP